MQNYKNLHVENVDAYIPVLIHCIQTQDIKKFYSVLYHHHLYDDIVHIHLNCTSLVGTCYNEYFYMIVKPIKS